jgi:membrane protein
VPLEILGAAASNFSRDRGTQMAASISYYALFSLFPLTLLAVSIFGIVIRDEALQVRVVDAIIDFLPVEGDTVENSIRNVAELGPTLTVISFFGTAWSAAALSASIRSALNVAFEATQRRPFLRGKLIDYALLPIISLPLLGGILISAFVRLAREEVRQWFPVVDELFGLLWQLVSLGVPFLLSFTAFLLIYWLLPNRTLRFRYLWPGAVLAALGFELVKSGFTYYLAHFGNFDVIYGSLGSVIILLFWVFITANILIFGAEVASEVPRVIFGEPARESDIEEPPGDWKRSLWRMVLGLVMVVEEETAPRDRRPAPEEPHLPPQPRMEPTLPEAPGAADDDQAEEREPAG